MGNYCREFIIKALYGMFGLVSLGSLFVGLPLNGHCRSFVK